ncbi:TH1 protein [Dimargaris cristalligena]|uniref:TH1 protein n=1 Tax=Dimargaris cristalligena TaxID=215637 RepID=A0A4P9ZWI4_9FUNG|nr:TH1 protein [Dimargaris cristalligena]|eukprot:RKP37222.1 TH1 protein [Dimargaris cristalligena]
MLLEHSIFEPNIYPSVITFLRCGGTPLDVVNYLSNNYVGLVPMCELLADEWCTTLGLNGTQIIYDTLKSVILERFDPEQFDKKTMGSSSPPDWLGPMIQHHIWRSVIYELSEQYPKSAFLNFAIQSISAAGYQSEITSATTASKYFNVYSNVLLDAIKDIKDVNESNFPEKFEVFEALLNKLIQENPAENYPLKRVVNDLGQITAQKHQNPTLLGNMNVLLAGLPVYNNEVSTAIMSIKQKHELSPGDLVALYKSYKGPTPPSIEYLRDIEIIEFLLVSVFQPPSDAGRSHFATHTVGLRPEIKDKYLWLLGQIIGSAPAFYPSPTAGEGNGHDHGQQSTAPDSVTATEATYRQLVALDKLLISKPTAADLAQLTGVILDQYIDVPILAAAVIIWLRHVLQDDNYHYYETYFRLTEAPLPHLLLEEIAHRHPGLQDRIFSAYQESFTARISTIGAELMTALQKSVLDRMLNLMAMGYALPVLNYVKRLQEKIDESLTVHFVRKVLDMIAVPYSKRVISILLEIAAPVVNTIIDDQDYHLAFSRLIDDLIDSPEDVLQPGETLSPDTVTLLTSMEEELPANSAFS